jgi:hypothetical protein
MPKSDWIYMVEHVEGFIKLVDENNVEKCRELAKKMLVKLTH